MAKALDTGSGHPPGGNVIHGGRAKGPFHIDMMSSAPIQGMAWVKATVNFDTATGSLISVKAGDVVHAVQVKTTTAWDGNGHFDLGLVGGDVDGFYDATYAKINAAGVKISTNADLGVFLWDATGGDTHPLFYAFTADDTIDATVTTGTSTAGSTDVYVLISRVIG